MQTILQEREALAHSLWVDTAHAAPERSALKGEIETDCVIIGAGFTGLSAALNLAEAGVRVVVLEAQTPGWGASGRNGGQVNPGLKEGPDAIEAHYGTEMGRRVVALSGGVGDLVFGLIARHGIACDPRRPGWIRASHSSKSQAALARIGAQWRARGADVDEVVSNELRDLLGTDAYRSGLIDRRGGSLHPLNYALGLAAAAERAGAKVYGQSPVSKILSADDSVVVTTLAGRVTAHHALVCTNAYTGDLAEPLGRSVMPVTSVQVATAPLSDNIARSILPEGHAVSDTKRLLLYFRKDVDGRFIMGGRGATSERSIRACQQDLRAQSMRLFPQLANATWEYAWGGDVALTRDHLPGLHRVAPRIMAGLGYNGRGVGMATAMGKVLADWVTGHPEASLEFPVTRASPIPFQRFRRVGMAATVAAFRVLDRVEQ
ncbi:MAG: FAD-binding oxidoreductase [Yoonia sp.]|uniref:NAD(P)/FAD-dependent oxidoreductase n=1 Tax=Yoonia sp. TaxID=2212373 RepID=UPI00273DFA16|nr:FAD-binding oxidoreductase [Yoonia sp.]MDP5084785.1 FAD-binding oxidoreductase [Yoonia sp.]